MTGSQLKLLSKMKKLIVEGKRRFALRKDRDYVEALLELGITEEEAWSAILRLNCNFYFPDTKPEYLKTSEALIFKMKVNNNMAYIKIKIEECEDGEETVCLSFHKDLMN